MAKTIIDMIGQILFSWLELSIYFLDDWIGFRELVLVLPPVFRNRRQEQHFLFGGEGCVFVPLLLNDSYVQEQKKSPLT